MNELKHFILPEHTNSLYKKEAISSISLTRDVAEKINELIDAYNELSKTDLAWKHEQQGKIEKGVIFMKDNLLNSINDLMESLGVSYIDDVVKDNIKALTAQIANLVNQYSALVRNREKDVEMVEARVSYAGYIFETLGEHIRTVTEDLKTLIENIEIANHEKVDLFVDVKGNATKVDGSFFRIPDSDVILAEKWNYYVLPVIAGEKYHIKTFTVSAGRCVAFINEDLENAEREPAFGYIPENPSNGEILEFTVEVPESAIKMIVNENISECECVIGKCYGQRYEKTTGEVISYLSNKTIVCCGDSITEAVNPEGGFFINYAERVAERQNMRVVKDGKGGSTIANIGNGKSFTEGRYLKHTEFDYLTIWFGWNDNAYSTLGTINDTTDTTFYGAYNKVMTHYLTNYPTKKFGLIVPYCSNDNIKNAVRKIAEKFNVPCLDLSTAIWDNKTDVGKVKITTFTYDGTHPNQNGYDFISTMYENFLLSL